MEHGGRKSEDIWKSLYTTVHEKEYKILVEVYFEAKTVQYELRKTKERKRPGRKFEFPGVAEILLYFTASRPALGSTHLLSNGYGDKLSEREADH
jgi:hypothetical protein